MVLHLNSPGDGTSQFAPQNHSCTVIPQTTADSSDRARRIRAPWTEIKPMMHIVFGISGFFGAPREWRGGIITTCG